MYSKRRTIPLSVSLWMEKDVSVRKATASSGLMPNDSRHNVFLSRQFYSDMLNLSSERHRKLARFDYNRKTFLKSQRQKAETNMPGLLPYIEPFKDDIKEEPTLSRNDHFMSSTLHSMTSRSIIKSDAIKQTEKKNKSKNRPKTISLERINQLSQPKSRRHESSNKEHIRPNIVKISTFENLFGPIDDNISYEDSFLLKEPEISTNDKRFRQLIHLFSEVHERKPSKLQSITNIVQSNASLRYNNERQEIKNSPTLPLIQHKEQQDILNDSFYSKTDLDFSDD